jgi:hypothetical protein
LFVFVDQGRIVLQIQRQAVAHMSSSFQARI